MNNDAFEWDASKARANLKKHGVSFEHAAEAFDDAFALIEEYITADYGEDRFVLIGRAFGGILAVIYTERGERIRIISAREANAHECT